MRAGKRTLLNTVSALVKLTIPSYSRLSLFGTRSTSIIVSFANL